MSHLVTIAKAIFVAALLLAFAVMQVRTDITTGHRAAEIDTYADPWANLAEPTHLSRALDSLEPTRW